MRCRILCANTAADCVADNAANCKPFGRSIAVSDDHAISATHVDTDDLADDAAYVSPISGALKADSGAHATAVPHADGETDSMLQ